MEENLTEGTSEKVSKRLEDAQLVAPHDTETGDIAEEVNKRRQLRPDELEDAVSQAQAETQSADAAQEYNPGDLPVSDDPTSHTLHSETYRTHSVDYGKAFADTAVTGKVSRPRAERQIDGESVLERAAETSAEMPLSLIHILCLKIMSILITVILYGRMIEIYCTVSLSLIHI